MSSKHFHYYQVAFLRSSSPRLSYRSEARYEPGIVVEVPVRQHPKRAVILAREAEPAFETEEILPATGEYFRPWQMEAARFIAEYYFSTLDRQGSGDNDNSFFISLHYSLPYYLCIRKSVVRLS